MSTNGQDRLWAAERDELPPKLPWLPGNVDRYLDFFIHMDLDGPPLRERTPAVFSLFLGDLPSAVDRKSRDILRTHLKEMSLELGLGFAAIALALPSTVGVWHLLLLIGLLLPTLAWFAIRVHGSVVRCLDAVVRAFGQMETRPGVNASVPVRDAFEQYRRLARDLPVFGIKLYCLYAAITSIVLQVVDAVPGWGWPILVVMIGFINCGTFLTRFNADDVKKVLGFAASGPTLGETNAQLDALRGKGHSVLEVACDMIHLVFPWLVFSVDEVRLLIHRIRLIVLATIIIVLLLADSLASGAFWTASGFAAIGVIGYGAFLWWYPKPHRPRASNPHRCADRSSSDDVVIEHLKLV